ncbi:putative zinc-binding peptidase [Halomonas sp. DP8Y7-1]|uniref:zinc-binding metallopeptidase family protein n=1 Tax=Halomonas sp. DP8Y7-1 TaxID=2859078 RepID=UPI001C978A8F|nr:putative zinc-binding metallopeptidase [Halomonas sp. DP8Y7-1]MBY6030124.1 putative zinc-binding peptidase [Halomonas sp. DP8Y7-1]
MRHYPCHRCDNRLFFDNTQCLVCATEVGWCPGCNALVAMERQANGRYRCVDDGCGTLLVKCHNYAVEGVCNRMLTAQEADQGITLCDCCRHNRAIPDLSIEGHRERWAKLESAKRRLFYTLDLLGLPHEVSPDKADPPLSFSFLADELPVEGGWHSSEEGMPVFTGHAGGHITINVKEADDVERERLRTDFNEAHRTLIGHFRHEIGHYYWELLIKGRDEDACIAVFGDHRHPSYSDALERHYQQGPPADWRERHLSAYATMHPWEDFAETFGFYLDMVAILDTAGHFGIPPTGFDEDLDAMLYTFGRLSLGFNEMNREMGLLDLVPEVITPTIAAKLRYVHEMVLSARHADAASQQTLA